MEFAGRVWRGKAHLVGLAAKGASLTLPPPGRHVHVVATDLLSGDPVVLSSGDTVEALMASAAHGGDEEKKN